MRLTIVPVHGEEALSLKEFIRPEVWEQPEWKSFWYLAARNEQGALIGAAAVDPGGSAGQPAEYRGFTCLYPDGGGH